MALWNGVGQVANIAQLTGVDAYGLIFMIVEAAKTVKRNQETCQQLARRVRMIGDLLQQLQSSQLMQHMETRNPMEQLEETLRHAYVLIASCGDRNYLYSCFTGGQLAEQLRQVQEEINFGLLLFPIIGLVDNTRSTSDSEQLMNRDRPSCSEVTTNGLDRPHHSEYDDRLRTNDLEAIRFNPQRKSGGKRTEGQVMDIGELGNLIGSRKVELPYFSFSQILAATKKFSARNLIGHDRFGDIYKGKLFNSLDIAVKRHNTNSIQGPEQFRTEIETIPNLRHKNIISLLGCCTKGEEKVLVYEYMPNSSLASIIYDEKKRELLKWSKRLQIIRGVADGLAYLHGHSHMCIVHRNLGSNGILLDHDMNAKISDFGFALMLAQNTYADVMVVGTYGHLAPEYAATGRISEKADVYKFGIVLLEIICGRRYGCDRKMVNGIAKLIDDVCKCCEDVRELVDPLLLDAKWHEREDQIMGCIKLALLCIHSLPENRPAMSEVVAMLDRIQRIRP